MASVGSKGEVFEITLGASFARESHVGYLIPKHFVTGKPNEMAWICFKHSLLGMGILAYLAPRTRLIAEARSRDALKSRNLDARVNLMPKPMGKLACRTQTQGLLVSGRYTPMGS